MQRNELLLTAGFAPKHPERGLNAPELLAVSSAFQLILDAHLPHPALLLDRWWDIVDRNSGAASRSRRRSLGLRGARTGRGSDPPPQLLDIAAPDPAGDRFTLS